MMAIEVNAVADELGIILRTMDAPRLPFLRLASPDCCNVVVAAGCI
jgi:hypothetical protein